MGEVFLQVTEHRVDVLLLELFHLFFLADHRHRLMTLIFQLFYKLMADLAICTKG